MKITTCIFCGTDKGNENQQELFVCESCRKKYSKSVAELNKAQLTEGSNQAQTQKQISSVSPRT